MSAPNMEGLSLNEPHQDPNAPPPILPGVPPQGAPQLPPQMFTTAAQLLDLTDKKLLLVLRDGRKLLGVLRTWDQFANLVLTDTKERYYVTTTTTSNEPSSTSSPPNSTRNLFCDIPRGTYLVRGENVLLIGEVDLDKDDEPPAGYEEGEIEEVFKIQREAEVERRKRDKILGKKIGKAWGGEMEGSGEVLF